MDFIFANQLLTFIIGLAVLIFFHELGHFTAARLLNVDVEEFGLGFPPKILKLFRAGGTDFTLNWIPLGGFVRLKGENDPDVEGGFGAASPWVRLTVLAAGPLTNILIGLILGMMFFYSQGEPVPNRVYVDTVVSGSPAEAAGMLEGDLFITANDVDVDYLPTLQEEISSSVGESMVFVMMRDGEPYTVEIVPRTEVPEGEGPIGVVLNYDTQSVSVITAMENGTNEFSRIVNLIVTLPMQILRGEVSPEEGRFVGYRGMFEIYQLIPSRLWFFMMISISLGIFNLLPFPALDGGRMLLIMPEILFRRRVPPQYENMIHLAGFIFLVLLMIWINIQDWINPLELPQ